MQSPEIRPIEPQTVAFLALWGSYDQIPAGYGRLYGWLARHGLESTGMPQAVYLTDPAAGPPESAAFELWAPVTPETPEQPPDAEGVGVKRADMGTAAVAVHVGTYDTIEQTYDALWAWVCGQGFEVCGPPSEVYFSDPATTKPEEYRTEVRVPVRKSSA